MTRKEKLYRDYIIEYNKVCELTGEALLDCSEEFFNSAVFRHEASVHTLLYWLDAIEYQKVRYSEELKRIRVEEYLNTDEGKELLKRRDELIDARAMFFKETEGLIDRNIKRWLGEQWGIWLYNNSICIGLVKEVDKDGLNKFHFGHTFDVLFSKSYKEAELKSFDLNYGTMGKFSLLEVNSLRSQLLVGMGKFVSNSDYLAWLKGCLTEFVIKLRELEDELNSINYKLANPPINDD